MKYNFLKNLISWLVALILAFLAINILCFFYYKDSAGYRRAGGAFSYVYKPGGVIVNLKEGAALTEVDDNGYLNRATDLSSDGYVLVLGNSMTGAIEVPQSDKYVSVLDDKLKALYGDDKTHAYLLSRGGADFAEIAEGVNAALTEFDNAKAVVIQIKYGELNTAAVEQLVNRFDDAADVGSTDTAVRQYTDSDSPAQLAASAGISQKLTNMLKDYFPFAAFVLNERVSALNNKSPFEGAFIFRGAATYETACEAYDVAETTAILEKTLRNIKTTVNIPVIIINLPYEELTSDGELTVSDDNNIIWKNACDEAGVTYIDMTDSWMQLFDNDKELAFGFSNTSPGSGHMNKAGHKAVGEKLYETLIQYDVFE